ncbi:hypothetical protein EJ08DRAFT_334860 [Tothia fuscella]|uniref:Uncharacterized protein n=1 Tax=Tothia fuscella TaxID=1048955 RepID=A0A9P4P146_9PEZI|nr:hypothetical protein EJ08DRAFT_334860 [Tothia fuscella]
MTFQFAHHRPLTPITPVHSPQPSVGSIRSRTPGQLSLHDYRKQQVTPSPPAVPGQRTVKRRFAASSLNKIERIPPDSPNAPLLPPHQYGSTPPLTPSLGPPTPTQLEFSPSKSLLSEDSFPDYLPDLAHLGSSDFNLSPPQSPFFFDAPPSEFNFLPDLLTSPTTPHTQPSFFSLRRKKPSDYTEDHSRSRSGYRAISQTQRLVNLTSVARTSRQSRSTPRKDTRDIRRDTSPLLSVDVPLPEDDYAPLPDGRQYSIYAPLPEDEFAPLPDGRLDSVLHSSRFERRAGAAFQVASANSSSVSPNLGQRQEFGGVRWSEGNQRKIDIVRSRPQTQLSPQRLDQGQQAQREAQPEAQ